MSLGKSKILSQGAVGGVVGTDNFNTVLYTGNGGTQSINTVGFQPDFVWTKMRSSVNNHQLFDSVRGVTKELESNTTAGEATNANSLTAFNSNGFTLGSSNNENQSGKTYVAWNWKAGGAAVSNTSGSITSQVSANTDAGFSIVEFTTSSNGTIGHGLSAAPQLIITKLYTRIGSWSTYSEPTGNTKYLQLDSGNAAATGTGRWNSTTPSASTFVLGSDFGSGHACICYCFTSIPGYQMIGSYTGSGVSGKSVTTGFQPRFLMIKGINFGNGYWFILDNQRTSGTNGKLALWANEALGESSSYDVRFDATGFTLLNTDTHLNQSYDYLYLAIA